MSTLQCRLYHYLPSPGWRPGTALQEEDLVTVVLTLACRHGTKRGQGAGVWYYLLLVIIGAIHAPALGEACTAIRGSSSGPYSVG